METKRLYVGNLPYSMDEEAIAKVFNVERDAVTLPREGDRVKGFGFVDVPEDQAEALIESMNGKDVEGRQLTVNEARPRTDRSQGGGGYNRDNRGGGGNWGNR